MRNFSRSGVSEIAGLALEGKMSRAELLDSRDGLLQIMREQVNGSENYLLAKATLTTVLSAMDGIAKAEQAEVPTEPMTVIATAQNAAIVLALEKGSRRDLAHALRQRHAALLATGAIKDGEAGVFDDEWVNSPVAFVERFKSAGEMPELPTVAPMVGDGAMGTQETTETNQ